MRLCTRTLTALLAASLACLPMVSQPRTAGAKQPGKEKPLDKAKPDPHAYALLVGVTTYENTAINQLEGGANDVLLMHDLLVEKFGFLPGNITILSEQEGKTDEKKFPTRENIKSQCEQLAKRARGKDKKAVVLLSGHGALQPEKPGVANPAADGFDRIFLPRDVKECPKEDVEGQVPGAISGRELGAWLRPIPESKALLWVVVDSCHSGEGLRGPAETIRQVDPIKALKIPKKAMENAAKRARAAAAKRGERTRDIVKSTLAPRLGELEGVALLYACNAFDVTVEDNYPRGAPDARRHGLLTYTLNRILRPATASLSYRELALRIHHEYTAAGRRFPTPVVDGKAMGQVILGGKRLPRLPIIVRQENEDLYINAGRLHGLTVRSILAIHPPAGEKGDIRGHIRIVRVKTTTALVEPCAFGKMKAPTEKVLIGGRAEVVQLDFGDLKLKVAVDRLAPGGDKKAKAGLDQLQRDLAELAKKENAPIELLSDQKQAEALVRIEDGKVRLILTAEWEDKRADRKIREVSIPVGELDGEARARLEAACTRIVRVHNLLRCAVLQSDFREESLDQVKVKIDLALEGATPAKGSAGPQSAVKTFYNKDVVIYKIQNTGGDPIDVTVLYINREFKITALFPDDESNRLEAGKEKKIEVDVRARQPGLEYAVVIAVKSSSKTLRVDFTSLAEPTIGEARGTAKKRGEQNERALDSPLGRLLRNALYKETTTRDASRRQIENFAIELVPLQIEKDTRPRDDK